MSLPGGLLLPFRLPRWREPEEVVRVDDRFLVASRAVGTPVAEAATRANLLTESKT